MDRLLPVSYTLVSDTSPLHLKSLKSYKTQFISYSFNICHQSVTNTEQGVASFIQEEKKSIQKTNKNKRNFDMVL